MVASARAAQAAKVPPRWRPALQPVMSWGFTNAATANQGVCSLVALVLLAAIVALMDLVIGVISLEAVVGGVAAINDDDGVYGV